MTSHRLQLHAVEDDVEHLRERRLSSGLVDEVLARQIDVVAGAHRQQHGALVNLARRRRHNCQQSLRNRQISLNEKK